jgi:hypothetical protein
MIELAPFPNTRSTAVNPTAMSIMFRILISVVLRRCSNAYSLRFSGFRAITCPCAAER